MKIKNVILDMGNVILDYNPDYSVNALCKSEGAKQIIKAEYFGSEEWIKSDAGLISKQDRFLSVSRRVPVEFHEDLKAVHEHWDICMKPLDGAVDFLHYLKDNGYRVFLLSNAGEEFFSYFPKQIDTSLFDGLVISCELKMLKPQKEIYEYLLNKYSLNSSECLFVDDRQDNVTGAQSCGINGFCFKNDYEAVKEYLSK